MCFTVKDKRQIQDNQGKEVRTKYKERTRKVPVGVKFSTSIQTGPPSLLYNGYCVYFPGVKRPGRGVNHPHPSNAAVEGKVELYFYSLCGPSWTVLGRIVPFTFTLRLFVYMASFSFGEIR